MGSDPTSALRRAAAAAACAQAPPDLGLPGARRARRARARGRNRLVVGRDARRRRGRTRAGRGAAARRVARLGTRVRRRRRADPALGHRRAPRAADAAHAGREGQRRRPGATAVLAWLGARPFADGAPHTPRAGCARQRTLADRRRARTRCRAVHDAGRADLRQARAGCRCRAEHRATPCRLDAGSRRARSRSRARPGAWERLGAPERITWFPASRLPVVLVSPRPGRTISPRAPVRLTFSKPLKEALDSAHPRFSERVSGTWRQTDTHTLVFTPSGFGWPLASLASPRLAATSSA